MAKPVISVHQLGKRYRLGTSAVHSTLRDHITEGIRGILFRKQRSHGVDASDFWALKDVSFDVMEGEVVGVIGRNGAGKSTLLKVLSQITEPTTGEVRVRGRVASLLEVGTGFHPELSGRENIFLNGAIMGMTHSEIRRKFDEIVAFSEVSEFIDTPVKRYSSGMHVRLAFAVAAHLDPEILVVDEVLAVGDVAFRKKCMGKMGEVAKGGRTVLFVSHNMSAVQLLCGRGLLLDSGSLKLDAPAKTVVSQYLSNFATSSQEVVDLANLPHKGSGRALLRTLQIRALSSGGEPLKAAKAGCDLEVIVGVEAIGNVQSLNVAVIIYDSVGYRVIDVNTALKECLLEMTAGGKREVRFVVRDLLLNVGTYFVGLWLGVGGVEHIDAIDFAASFEVVQDFGTHENLEFFPGTYVCRFDMEMNAPC